MQCSHGSIASSFMRPRTLKHQLKWRCTIPAKLFSVSLSEQFKSKDKYRAISGANLKEKPRVTVIITKKTKLNINLSSGTDMKPGSSNKINNPHACDNVIAEHPQFHRL
eukprot:5257321-Amphidinium_carterae.1